MEAPGESQPPSPPQPHEQWLSIHVNKGLIPSTCRALLCWMFYKGTKMRRNSMRIAKEMKFWLQPVHEPALHMRVPCSSWTLRNLRALVLPSSAARDLPILILELFLLPSSCKLLLISGCFSCPWPWCWCLCWGFPAPLFVLKVLGLKSPSTHTYTLLGICAFIFLLRGHVPALSLLSGCPEPGLGACTEQDRDP